MTLHQHGLGLAGIPEVDTGLAAQGGVAQNALVARAQGSLVPRQDQPAATTPVGLGQQAGQPATAKATRKPGTIDFEKDPLGSIGLILREAGAALQHKPSPSAEVRKNAKVDERVRAGLELQAQGLRLRAASQRMDVAIKGMELVSNMPPNEAQAFIADFQKKFGSEDFDVGSIMQQHYGGELEGALEDIKRLKANPIAAAFFAQGEFEGSSPRQLRDRAKSVLKLMDNLTGKVLEQKALAPGVEAAKKTTAQRNTEFLAGLPAGEKRDIAEKLLLDEKGTDSFFRALDELSKLAEGGKTPDNDSRAKTVQKRVDSLIDKSGFSITFDDKGRVTGITQGAQPFSDLGAKDKQKALAEIDTVNKTIDLLDGVIGKIDEDPTLFGIVGTGRRLGQTLAGVASDLGGIIEKATGVDINKGAERIAKALSGTPLEAEFEGIFNPTLSKLQLLENTLAFDLARLRLTSGGGNIRALKQAFIDAKEDVQLTGATSSKDVRARMVEVKSQFVRELRNVTRRLTGKAVERKEASESKDDDLKRRVDKILGIGK